MIIEKNMNGIEGLTVISPTVFYDIRGFFMQTYNQKTFEELGTFFVQDNQSKSIKNVLRGLHYQINYPQAKLIRAIRGAIYDVAVDLRKDSPTYKQWYGIELSEENKKQFFIPRHFAHGFLVLSDQAEICYKCDDFYHPEDESGIIWNDPTLNIDWPIEDKNDLIISYKDSKWGKLP